MRFGKFFRIAVFATCIHAVSEEVELEAPALPDVPELPQVPDKFIAGYNLSSSVNAGMSIFVTGDFLYWYAQQEMMDLSDAIILDNLQDNHIFSFQRVNYKPGFKIGAGYNSDFDNWVFFAEYTRFHSTYSQSFHSLSLSPTATFISTSSPWAQWFTLAPGQPFPFKSRWHLGVDLIDASISRPYIEGASIGVMFFGGLRGGWIDQSLVLNGDSFTPGSVVAPGVEVIAESHTRSTSWLIGPRGGVEAFWFLWRAFRFQGKTAITLPYTRYSLSHEESSNLPTLVPNREEKIKNYNAIRSMIEVSLGLGWGQYCFNRKTHFDFSLSYDFNMMWSQNMIRATVDNGFEGIGSSPGDLHLHGLRLQGQLDF